jgi:hypothetical protein
VNHQANNFLYRIFFSEAAKADISVRSGRQVEKGERQAAKEGGQQ